MGHILDAVSGNEIKILVRPLHEGSTAHRHGVVCRRKYDDAGSNERRGLDGYYPAQCSSRKFIIDSQENVEREPRGRYMIFTSLD